MFGYFPEVPVTKIRVEHQLRIKALPSRCFRIYLQSQYGYIKGCAFVIEHLI